MSCFTYKAARLTHQDIISRQESLYHQHGIDLQNFFARDDYLRYNRQDGHVAPALTGTTTPSQPASAGAAVPGSRMSCQLSVCLRATITPYEALRVGTLQLCGKAT